MRSKVVDIGSFVIVPERKLLETKGRSRIGSITKISYSSGEKKDFA